MSARFKALNTAQRTVVVGSGFHTIPNFGLSCSVSLSRSPYVKSPLAPSMNVRSFRGVMYLTFILGASGDFTYGDRKSTRLNSSHVESSYAVFCFKKENTTPPDV